MSKNTRIPVAVRVAAKELHARTNNDDDLLVVAFHEKKLSQVKREVTFWTEGKNKAKSVVTNVTPDDQHATWEISNLTSNNTQ